MNRIKKIRLEQGLKQKDIAEKTGLSISAISLFENGKKKPSVNNAYKIANSLEKNIEEVFFFNPEQPREVN